MAKRRVHGANGGCYAAERWNTAWCHGHRRSTVGLPRHCSSTQGYLLCATYYIHVPRMFMLVLFEVGCWCPLLWLWFIAKNEPDFYQISMNVFNLHSSVRGKKGKDVCRSLLKPITELRSVTCQVGSHSITCHPTQVNAPRFNPSHAGRYSIYVPQRDGRLSWPWWLVICCYVL